MAMSSIPIDPSAALDSAIAALNTPGAELPVTNVDRALKVAPGDARLWHVKGLMHREQERRDLAIPALRRAAELAPHEPLIAHGYARTLLEAGLPSVQAFAQAMTLARDNPEVVRGMMSALIAEGQVETAHAGLDQVLRRSPLWADGHTLLSSLRWSEGERAGFTRSFDEAIQQQPDSIDLWRQQLVALVEAEHFDDALARIADGRSRFGDHLIFASHEAVIRSELGEVEAADRLFDEIPVGTTGTFDVRRVRHQLRFGRAAQASAIIELWLNTPDQFMFWPYASAAWRIAGDNRSEWLEGDERLVGVYDIADRLPPLPRLAQTLRKLHTARSQPFSQSVRGGTQTDGHLFQRIEPDIMALADTIRQVVAEHSAKLPPIDPTHPLLRFRPDRVRFSGAWSVRLASGGNHANHVHPMGWLSSALYLVLPEDLGTGDHAGWLTLGEPQAQLQLDLPPLRMVEPKPGRLALFPSWMWHGTRPFGAGERLTVAFDVAP